jgi:hypothetical protein
MWPQRPPTLESGMDEPGSGRTRLRCRRANGPARSTTSPSTPSYSSPKLSRLLDAGHSPSRKSTRCGAPSVWRPKPSKVQPQPQYRTLVRRRPDRRPDARSSSERLRVNSPPRDAGAVHQRAHDHVDVWKIVQVRRRLMVSEPRAHRSSRRCRSMCHHSQRMCCGTRSTCNRVVRAHSCRTNTTCSCTPSTGSVGCTTSSICSERLRRLDLGGP